MDVYVAPVSTTHPCLRGSALAVAVPVLYYKNRIKLPYKLYKLLSGQIHPAVEEKRWAKAKRLIFVTVYIASVCPSLKTRVLLWVFRRATANSATVNTSSFIPKSYWSLASRSARIFFDIFLLAEALSLNYTRRDGVHSRYEETTDLIFELRSQNAQHRRMRTM